jgi:hypothetical protein
LWVGPGWPGSGCGCCWIIWRWGESGPGGAAGRRVAWLCVCVASQGRRAGAPAGRPANARPARPPPHRPPASAPPASAPPARLRTARPPPHRPPASAPPARHRRARPLTARPLGRSADECGSGAVRCDPSPHPRLGQRQQQVIGRAQALACGMTRGAVHDTNRDGGLWRRAAGPGSGSGGPSRRSCRRTRCCARRCTRCWTIADRAGQGRGEPVRPAAG